MKTLIVYYSHTANNEKLAHELQQKLNCDILKIEELKKRTMLTIMLDLMFSRHPAIKTNAHVLTGYEHIIFIAPIWAGQIASPLKTFLANEKSGIKSYSFITVCGGGGQRVRITKQLFRMLQKEPVAVTELPIDKLLRQNSMKTSTSRYRLTEKDWDFFELRLDNFLSKNGMPLARGWEVES